MPLMDHFHPPLSQERHWESFRAAWIGSLADDLNRQLPEGYLAEEQTHAGAAAVSEGNGTATATMPAKVWSPRAPALTLPAVFADDFEVRIFSTRTGPKLVAAIELVSPANKDRPEARRAFAVKCASYLHQGISLIVVDVVTGRNANLHNEILVLLQAPEASLLPVQAALYAVAFRPIRREDRDEFDLWRTELAVSKALPVLPLALNAEVCLPVDFEATYVDACERRRLTGASP